MLAGIDAWVNALVALGVTAAMEMGNGIAERSTSTPGGFYRGRGSKSEG
jgi:hypothetical protein